MADRGFVIRDLLLTRKATLRIPPFTTKCKWGKGKRGQEDQEYSLFYTLCVLFFYKWFQKVAEKCTYFYNLIYP
jgi:hypothetical protein